MVHPHPIRDFNRTERSASVLAALVMAAGIGVMVMPARCRATPLAVVIEVDRTPAAADCADGRELLAKVEAIAQRPLAADRSNGDTIRVALRFDHSSGEYRAHLQFEGPKPGERSLSDQSRSCEPLEDAAAVAIALLLDREIERRERDATELSRAASTIKIIRGEVEPKRLQTVSWQFALEGGALAGLNSAVTELVAVDVGLRPFAGWLFESSAWATLPATTTYGAGSVKVSLVAGAVRGCRLWGTQWQSGPCAGFALGRLHGAGQGYDEALASSLLWSAVGASWLVQRSLGPNWDLGLHALAWVLPGERRFMVQNAGIAWNSARVMPGLSVRLGFRFN